MLAEQRRFPILDAPAGCPKSVPWSLVEPHAAQAASNHGGQTLERLAERGGLCPSELYAVVHDQRWRSGLRPRAEEWLRGLGE